MTAPLAAPPYALAANEFPVPGLAALVARAPVGGQRETALACLVLARLAAAIAPPVQLSVDMRRERAEAARAWLSAMPVDSDSRALIQAAIGTTISASGADVALALEGVAEKLAQVLDRGGSQDLLNIAQRLRR